jgi:hypothetical protein
MAVEIFFGRPPHIFGGNLLYEARIYTIEIEAKTQ